ncbi:U32 family peptidase [Marichromatium gracile]|uniref:ubiquinone anaerobic biosynthesis protein UbiU n=1 Tax=Marichromatium gracile TaxID=1048 RepID=UPI001F47B720|nr:peptidase U32 family protein [Marichromatium gracile]MCF1183598.1 U32 family peptidase [Marichromatium gracile]
MELVCPAGNLPALKAAVDNGANAVYIGFRDDTNARHFAGLNFGDKQIRDGLRYAHDRNVKVLVAVNTYAQPNGWERWSAAVDRAADLGVDAMIAADMGVLDYAANKHPQLNLHLSVQGSATNPAAINFMHRQFGIKRVVVPRVLSLAQVAHLIERCDVPVEIFGFGSLCVMVEGRCLLSSYATGQSPNTFGACSPASHVEWIDTAEGQETRLGGVLLERRGHGEPAGYPTICKGRFQVEGKLRYAIEEPTSLNTMEILPDIIASGVSAIKIEGRQRSTRYVTQVTRVWREAIDACRRDPQNFRPRDDWRAALAQVSEGTQTTLGPYHRQWH